MEYEQPGTSYMISFMKQKCELVYGDHKAHQGFLDPGLGRGCKGPCRSQNPGNGLGQRSASVNTSQQRRAWPMAESRSWCRLHSHRPVQVTDAKDGQIQNFGKLSVRNARLINP